MFVVSASFLNFFDLLDILESKVFVKRSISFFFFIINPGRTKQHLCFFPEFCGKKDKYF